MTLKLPIQCQSRSNVTGCSEPPVSSLYLRSLTVSLSTGGTVQTLHAFLTFLTLKWPINLIQGQRSWCIFVKWATVNIFEHRHPGPRSSRSDATLDFHFRDLKMTPKWPLKVNQGQSWRCTFINWAMGNIFVHRHPGPRSNRLDDTGHFHFRDLEMTPSRSSEVKFVCGFWKADIDFPIVFHRNHAYLAPWRRYTRFSHSWPWNDLYRSIKVKGQDALLLIEECWTFLFIDTLG